MYERSILNFAMIVVFSRSKNVRKQPSIIAKLRRLGKRIIAPAGFWPRGQNPRRQPKSPRVYTYKDKERLLKK